MHISARLPTAGNIARSRLEPSPAGSTSTETAESSKLALFLKMHIPTVTAPRLSTLAALCYAFSSDIEALTL